MGAICISNFSSMYLAARWENEEFRLSFHHAHRKWADQSKRNFHRASPQYKTESISFLCKAGNILYIYAMMEFSPPRESNFLIAKRQIHTRAAFSWAGKGPMTFYIEKGSSKCEKQKRMLSERVDGKWNQCVMKAPEAPDEGKKGLSLFTTCRP